MSDEETDDHVIRAARAIAVGESISWAEVPGASSADTDLLHALRDIERVAAAHQVLMEAPAPAFTRWAHLTIVERGERTGSLQRCRVVDSRGKHLALALIGPLSGAALRVEMLLRLGRRAATIHHPNLAAVHGADYAQDHLGLWYDDEPGRLLSELVRAEGALTVDTAARILRDVARATGALHLAGVVHGNISESAITLASDGRVVLLPSVSLEGSAQGDVDALVTLLRQLHPGHTQRLRKAAASVSSASAFELAVERLLHPWWTSEWFIGFVTAILLIAMVLWLVAA